MMKLRKKTYKKIYFLKFIIIFFELLMLKCLIYIKNKSSSNLNNNLKNHKSKYIIKRNLNYKIKNLKRNKTNINTLIIIGKFRFGNYFVSLNNAIIFCEFLCCKRIIINNDFIKHKIFYKKYNLTIESSHSFHYIKNDSLILNIRFFFLNVILLI